MYKVKYNNIDLEYFGIITKLKKAILPKRKYTSFTTESLDGEVYNSSKYEPLEIEITLFVEGETESELKNKLVELASLFNTKQVLPLELNNEKFAFAITSDEIETEEFSNVAKYVKINLICLDPHFYSIENKAFDSENNILTVENEGGQSVLPFVTIGFSKDTHFIQLEHEESGKKILIGNYPQLNLSSKKEKVIVLRDVCETTTNWINSQPSIDSDRTMGGTLAVTNSGEGVCIGSLPSGSTTWKGVCSRQNLDNALDEFTVRCNMYHNSTGNSGDPTKPTLSEDTSSTVSGVRESYYKVTSSTLNYRTGAGTKYKKLGTLKKGFEIYKGTVSKGWVKFQYKNKTCYASTKYLTKKYRTNKVTTYEKNFIVNTRDNVATFTVVRSQAKQNSKKLCTLENGTVVRCGTKVYTDPDDKTRTYYKMAKKIDGIIGYINTVFVVPAENVTFDYDEKDDYLWADDKMGIIELYGFDENGSKLFKLSMVDDNKYYEYTYPMAQIGNRTVLKDKTKVPKPEKLTHISGSGDNYVIKPTYYMSGKIGDWNDFWGTWELTRKKVKGKYRWEVSVKKIKDGKIVKTSKELDIKYTDLPTEKLSYVALYMGTNGELSNSSAMALTHLEVDELNPESETEENIAYFEEGDILDLDFESGTAYLNHENRTDLIDVGSDFFDIETGTNNIKIVSDDTDNVTSAVIKEKWIGGDY